MTQKQKAVLQEFRNLDLERKKKILELAEQWNKYNRTMGLGGMQIITKLEMEKIENEVKQMGISDPVKLFWMI